MFYNNCRHIYSAFQFYTGKSAKQPYGSAKQPYGSAKQPYGSAKQPYGSAKQPYGSAKRITVRIIICSYIIMGIRPAILALPLPLIIVTIVCIYFLYQFYQKSQDNPYNATIKIGVIMNYPILESSKTELIYVYNSSPSYIKEIPKQYLTPHGNRLGYPYDVVICYYIKKIRPDIALTLIYPEEITLDLIKKQDLVFLLIHDLLESLNVPNIIKNNESLNSVLLKNKDYGLPTNARIYKDMKILADLSMLKTLHKKFQRVLRKAPNIYPPYNYQKFFMSKCKYYKFLKDSNISIVPTKCISSSMIFPIFFKQVLKFIDTNKWTSFITKPDGGSDSIMFRIWKKQKKPVKSDKDSIIIYYSSNDDLKVKLHQYYTDISAYSNIIIQKYVNGFNFNGPKIPYNQVATEAKTYYVGDSYMYTVLLDRYGFRQTPDEASKRAPKKVLKENEGPIISSSIHSDVKKFSGATVRVLPKIIVNGVRLPRLLTRVDVGIMSEMDSKEGPKGRDLFLNEIEYVPSLFAEGEVVDLVNNRVFEKLGDQIVKIAAIYKGVKQNQ